MLIALCKYKTLCTIKKTQENTVWKWSWCTSITHYIKYLSVFAFSIRVYLTPYLNYWTANINQTQNYISLGEESKCWV